MYQPSKIDYTDEETELNILGTINNVCESNEFKV